MTRQIQEALKKTNTSHLFGQRCVKINKETEDMFREFAEICEQGFEFS